MHRDIIPAQIWNRLQKAVSKTNRFPIINVSSTYGAILMYMYTHTRMNVMTPETRDVFEFVRGGSLNNRFLGNVTLSFDNPGFGSGFFSTRFNRR